MSDEFNEQSSVARCPSDEVLGSYAEGELPPQHPAAVHIAGCSVCQMRLRQLDEGLAAWKDRIEDECSDVPVERIKEEVRRKLREEEAG